MFHTVNLLCQSHGQVNHHGATTDGLVDLVLIHVRDKDNTTFEVERTRQIVILHVCIPGDNTFTVAVQSTFEQVQSNSVLQNSVAVIKHDSTLLVLKQSAIQTLSGRVTLDEHEALTSIENSAHLEVSQIRDVLQTIGFQSLSHGIGLTESTFTSDHSRGLNTSGDHGNQLLNKGESLIDTVFFVFGSHHLLSFSNRTRHFSQFSLNSRFVLATNHDFTVQRTDKFARSGVKRDSRFHRGFLFDHHVRIIRLG